MHETKQKLRRKRRFLAFLMVFSILMDESPIIIVKAEAAPPAVIIQLDDAGTRLA